MDSCLNSILESASHGKLGKLIDKCLRVVNHAKRSGTVTALEAPTLFTPSHSTSHWLATFHSLNWWAQNIDQLSLPTSNNQNGHTNDDLDNDLVDLLLNSNEREMILDLIGSILEPLSEVYDELSNPNNVASGFVFPAIYSLVNYELPDVIETRRGVISELADELAASLKNRFDFLFNNESPLHKCFLAATLLDCRFKQFQFVRNDQERFALMSHAKTSLAEFYSRIVVPNCVKSPARSDRSGEIVMMQRSSTTASTDRKRISFVDKMLNRYNFFK